jgi:predicted RNA-binding Zn ribbon-like protein
LAWTEEGATGVFAKIIDGLLLPMSFAGHPVLDFCNTRAAWSAPVPKEYLKTHAHLTVWAGANGLLAADDVPRLRRAAARSVPRADSIVERAIRFRSALYSVLVGPAMPEDWAVVNAEVPAAGSAVALRPVASRPGAPATWTLVETGLELPLLSIVWTATLFLTTPAAGAVAACPSHDCGWLFPNPTGRRRWCSMALCGNRAKARRHAERARRGTQ